MDRIGSYGIYQNNYYNSAKSSKTDSKTVSKTKESEGASRKPVELSNNAKKLLKDLQKTYGNTDFIVADYENEEEAAAYLSRGTSKYSVLLTPDELERMASDENVKNKNLKTLDDAFAKLDEMKEKLGEKGQEVSRLGIVMGDNGEVSFFAELEKSSQMQRERIEERRESNREEAKEDAKAELKEKVQEKMDARREGGAGSLPGRVPAKRTTVFGSSIEELLENINNVDWDRVTEPSAPSGYHFNQSV